MVGKKELVHTLLVHYRATIDRAVGEAVIHFPPFVPKSDLLIPEGATHFKMLSAAAALDIARNSSFTAMAESEFFALNTGTVEAFNLSQHFTPTDILPVVVVLGIRFYAFVNGNYHQLYADDFNAVRIVAVEYV